MTDQVIHIHKPLQIFVRVKRVEDHKYTVQQNDRQRQRQQHYDRLFFVSSKIGHRHPVEFSSPRRFFMFFPSLFARQTRIGNRLDRRNPRCSPRRLHRTDPHSKQRKYGRSDENRRVRRHHRILSAGR